MFALTFNQCVGNCTFLDRVVTTLCMALWKGLTMAECEAYFARNPINIATDFFLFDNDAKFYEFKLHYKYLFTKQLQMYFDSIEKDKVTSMNVVDQDSAPHAMRVVLSYFERHHDYKLPIVISFIRANDDKMVQNIVIKPNQYDNNGKLLSVYVFNTEGTYHGNVEKDARAEFLNKGFMGRNIMSYVKGHTIDKKEAMRKGAEFQLAWQQRNNEEVQAKKK